MTTGSIVLDVCKEMHVLPEEFFNGSRRHDVVEARKEAIKRFMAADFSIAGTARVMRVHFDTVRYWANPRHREKKLARLERLKEKLIKDRRDHVLRAMQT